MDHMWQMAVPSGQHLRVGQGVKIVGTTFGLGQQAGDFRQHPGDSQPCQWRTGRVRRCGQRVEMGAKQARIGAKAWHRPGEAVVQRRRQQARGGRADRANSGDQGRRRGIGAGPGQVLDLVQQKIGRRPAIRELAADKLERCNAG